MFKMSIQAFNFKFFTLILMLTVVVLMLYADYIRTIDWNEIYHIKSVSSNFDEAFQWCRNESNIAAPLFSCQALFAGDKKAVVMSKNLTSACQYEDKVMASISENCATLRRIFPFYWSSSEPNDFRLAFVVLVARNAEQVVRLFQTVYRPWNLCCITYDDDAHTDFKRTMKNLHRCYERNILIPKTFVSIEWGAFSILQSEMNCLRVLNEHYMKWRYVQILSWNDFPLRTNTEMMQILQLFNGAQDSELVDGQAERYRKYHVNEKEDPMKKTWKKPVPPGGLNIYKGSMAVTLSRQFLAFVLKDQIMNDSSTGVQPIGGPRNTSSARYIHTGVPGGFPASCLPYYKLEHIAKTYISRYQVWYANCGGKLTKGSCVFGVADLAKLVGRPELVAHKFYLEFEPAALYCMNELHFNRTFGLSTLPFDLSFYENLPSVRYQRSVDKNSFQC